MRLIVYTFLVLMTCLLTYMVVDHNRDDFYCRAVYDGGFYHLRLHGQPCILTWEAPKKVALYFSVCVILIELVLMTMKCLSTTLLHWRKK